MPFQLFGDTDSDDHDYLTSASDATDLVEAAEKQALLADLIASLRMEVQKMEADEWKYTEGAK